VIKILRIKDILAAVLFTGNGRFAPMVVAGCAFTVMFSLLLTGCGGGGGGSASSANPPLIQAILFGLPPGKQAPAGFTNAVVTVQSTATGGTPVTNATVSMNGVRLVYNSAPLHEEYEGTVDVNPGDSLTLAVTTGGQTYTASGTQFTTYPTMSAPASGDAWSVRNAYYVTWSGGVPLTHAVYLVAIMNANDPNGIPPIIQTYPNNQTNAFVLGSSFTPGNWDVFAGIAGEAAVANADPSSGFVYGGFDYVPITVYEWTSRPINGVMTGLVWNGSQFAAVGLDEFDGLIFTSPDAVTWTQRTVPGSSPSDLHAVTWSGTQFVAVGDNGTVLTSPDGAGWTRYNSYASLVGVASSGVVYAGVDAFGNIYTSPDASTWTLKTSVPGMNLGGIVWSGTQFVAVGGGGTIVTAPASGVTWTPQTSNSTDQLSCVAWSGTAFVAMGYTSNVLTSPDGVQWTVHASAIPGSAVSVIWAGNQFVAVGSAGNIYLSPDGVTWTVENAGTISYLYAVAWDGTQLVAAGDNIVVTQP